MQKHSLNLAQVVPGMKLAKPITNASGITLMPAGIRLTPMFIIRLKKWNIDTVEVFMEVPVDKNAGSPPQQSKRSTSSANLTAEQAEFARAVAVDVSRVFANLRENPLMMELRSVAIKRLVVHGRNGMINVMRRGVREGE